MRLPAPALVLLALAASCRWGAAREWEEAQRLWVERDAVRAYRAWLALDPATPEGEEAHRRLAQAAAHYDRGIRLLERGAPEARAELAEAIDLAPMNPALYLPLARAYRDRQAPVRAADFYRRFIAALPGHPEVAQAIQELQAVDPEGPVWGPALTPPRDAGRPGRLALVLGAVGLAILGGGGMGLGLRRRRRARRSLRQLVAEQPELHPALAYAVGCLRHELLKHRIGAALAALARVGEDPEDARLREFVRARVAGDEPLGVAWKGHLGALERSLGGRVRLEASDARFRAAGGAVRRLARLAPALLDGKGGPARRGLAEVRAELASFDAYLGGLLGELVRARVDGDFLAKVVESVRRELGEEAAGLDELAVAPPPEPVRVEMYGIDLRIILRNLLRNAIQAALVGGAPRRVRLDVTLALEPTGEEVVRLRVQDTSEERLGREALRRSRERVDRGLGLVSAATERYGGVLELGPGEAGFAKAVVVRLFRALDDEAEGEGGDAGAAEGAGAAGPARSSRSDDPREAA